MSTYTTESSREKKKEGKKKTVSYVLVHVICIQSDTALKLKYNELVPSPVLLPIDTYLVYIFIYK